LTARRGGVAAKVDLLLARDHRCAAAPLALPPGLMNQEYQLIVQMYPLLFTKYLSLSLLQVKF
jgi:hypothetical protein